MAIPRTMRAAVVEEFGKPLVVKEVPTPTPGPGQALVEIAATGVCHTDLHAAEGDWPVKPVPPFIPGHEGAGTVVALGPGVTHLKIGDRVGIAWLHSACGHCEFCLAGWETLCLEQKNSGYSIDGSFAEYAIGQADWGARLDALDWQVTPRVLAEGMALRLPALAPLRILIPALQVRSRGEIAGRRFDDAVKRDARFDAHAMQQIDEIFGREVAARAGSVGAAAEPAGR